MRPTAHCGANPLKITRAAQFIFLLRTHITISRMVQLLDSGLYPLSITPRRVGPRIKRLTGLQLMDHGHFAGLITRDMQAALMQRPL